VNSSKERGKFLFGGLVQRRKNNERKGKIQWKPKNSRDRDRVLNYKGERWSEKLFVGGGGRSGHAQKEKIPVALMSFETRAGYGGAT